MKPKHLLTILAIIGFSLTGLAQERNIVLKSQNADSTFVFQTTTGRFNSLAGEAFKLQQATINGLISQGYSPLQVAKMQELALLDVFEEDARDTIVISQVDLKAAGEKFESLHTQKEASASARTAGGGGSATPGESGDSESLVVMPSPASLGLVNTGADMVELYTGDLNYNIPLYNLQSRELSVPISVSYSSRDIKVDNIASHVGLGWNLKAGGVITRVMRGLPDEFQGKINGTSGSTLNEFNGYGWLKVKNRSIGSDKVVIKDPNDFKSRFDVGQRKNLIENSALGGNVMNLATKTEGWDTEPDEFYFNFGKYSGKFVFTQDGDIKTVPHQNLVIEKKIEKVDGEDKIIEFVVKTPDGDTYTFGNSDPANLSAVEESRLVTLSLTDVYSYPFVGSIDYFYQNGAYAYSEFVYDKVPMIHLKFNRANQWILDVANITQWTYQYFTSTWHLKKIESQNDQMTFNYTDLGEINYFQSKGSTARLPNLPRFGEGFFISLDEPVNSATINIFPDVQTHTRSFNEIFLKAKKLSSIQTSVGTVAHFDSFGSRQDFKGDRKLDKIRIVNGGQELFAYKFDYFYKYSDPESHFVTPGIFDGALVVQQLEIPGTEDVILFTEDIRVIDAKAKLDPNFSTADFNHYINLFEAEHKRLMLGSITEYRNGSNKFPSTSFTYNETNIPRRFSSQQDKWGYYNANNRGTLIPKVSYNSILSGYPKVTNGLVMWDQIRITNSFNISHIGVKWNCGNGDCSRNGAIRGAHSTRYKASVLDKIDHPLGGITNFTYTRKKDSSGPMITQIDHSPENGISSTIQQKFSYGTAVAPKIPGHAYSLKGSELHRNHIFSSHALNSAFLTQGSFVGFSKASVSQQGKGKTEYLFETATDIANDKPTILEYNSGTSSVSGGFPYPPEENDWMRGRIKRIAHFREGETSPISTQDFDYELARTDYTYGFKPGMYGWRGALSSFPAYRAAFYRYNSSVYRIRETIEGVSDQNDLANTTEKITTYGYINDEYPGYVNSIVTQYNDGTYDKVENNYVFDYFNVDDTKPSGMDITTEGLWLMKEKGSLVAPVEVISYRRESSTASWNVIGGVLNVFWKGSRFASNTDNQDVFLKEKKVLGLASSIIESDLNKSQLNGSKTSFNSDSRYVSSLVYNDYNSVGKPVETTDRDGLTSKLTWAHSNSLVSSVTENSTGSIQMKSSYTYKPLVGMTSSKDINNRTTKYQYDNFNRLHLRKDHNNDIIDRYRYNYREAPEEPSIWTSIGITGGMNLTCRGIQFNATFDESKSFGQPEYKWDFGDSANTSECLGPIDGLGTQNTTGKSVYHRFSEPGVYTVTLTLSHPEYGKSITRSTSVTIYDLRAPIKINGSTTVEGCADGGGGFNEQGTSIDIPIDGDWDGDGSTPYTYFSIGWEPGGARCYTPGEYSSSLEYKNLSGTWVGFSTTRSGSLPPEAFRYSSSTYTIQIRGKLRDKCGSIEQTALKTLTVTPCTNTGGGGNGNVGEDQN